MKGVEKDAVRGKRFIDHEQAFQQGDPQLADVKGLE